MTGICDALSARCLSCWGVLSVLSVGTGRSDGSIGMLSASGLSAAMPRSSFTVAGAATGTSTGAGTGASTGISIGVGVCIGVGAGVDTGVGTRIGVVVLLDCNGTTGGVPTALPITGFCRGVCGGGAGPNIGGGTEPRLTLSVSISIGSLGNGLGMS